MIRPELVIFDCDGVLVDSEPLTNAILQADLAERGLLLEASDIDSLFVGGTMSGVAKTAADMGANIPDGWVDLIYARMYTRLGQGTPLVRGVEALLDQLDANGIPYCVGSNGSEEKMQITLGQHPGVFARLQGKLYSAHTLKTAKPDPDLYLIAAKNHGVLPQHCVVIDDSAPGCTAARRAGMRCLGLAEHHDGKRLAEQEATVIHNLSEVAEQLNLQ